MSISSAHNYFTLGLSEGLSEEVLAKAVNASKPQLRLGNPTLYSLKHLSHYTAVDYHYLRKVISREITPYESYRIPKRSGGFRYLKAPEHDLKTTQKWIASNILSNTAPHWACYSYYKNSSIKKCALQHCNSQWLIKIDIERFFEAIPESKVYRVFRKMGYKSLVSFELTRLCTVNPKNIIGRSFKRWLLTEKKKDLSLPYIKSNIKYIGYLPQGAPTSPQLSNLVFYEVDSQLETLAEEYGMNYTRYADDICFSTRDKKFTRKSALLLVRKVNRLLSIEGYSPQHKKLKIIPPGAKKIVLGLNVNGELPNLQKSYIKIIENHLRGMDKFGLVSHKKNRGFLTVYGMLDHVRGLINYAIHINPKFVLLMDEFNLIVERSGLGS
jgi:RNA-directed DNA polymerase